MSNFDFKKYLAEGRLLKEDLDLGHQDNEPGMIKGDLYQIGKASIDLYKALDQFDGMGEVDLPSWWQNKIFKAKEAITGAKEYLDFELNKPQIDAVVDAMNEDSFSGAEIDPNVLMSGEPYKNDYANSEEDYTDSMVIEKIKDIIRYHELDPSDVLEEIGQEFGIAFEFGRGQ